MDKKDLIEETIKNLKSKFGEESIMRLGDQPKVGVNSLPTGSIGLDHALGIGGYPRGRLIEIYGPESSGKTTLVLHAIAEAQKQKGICLFVDAEHALDPDYAAKIGVNLKNLLVSQPNSGEEALDIVDTMIKSKNIDLIVVDSVAALTPKAEIEGEMQKEHIGRQARLMSKALRKITATVSKSKTIVIFTNQIRMNIGAMGFGNPETTPGGRAMKFFASVRLDIRRIAKIKKGEEIVGGKVRVKVAKNKVSAPFKSAEFVLLYSEGITQEGELLLLGEKFELIKKSGSSYSYGEDKLGRGYDAARTTLKENKKLKSKLLKEVKEQLKKS